MSFLKQTHLPQAKANREDALYLREYGQIIRNNGVLEDNRTSRSRDS